MAGYKFTKSALQVLERSVIPFVVFQRLAGRIVPLVISAGFCDLFAHTREEALALLNHDMYMNVHPDDKDRLLAEVNRFISKGGSLNIVFRLKTEKRKDDMIVHLQGERLIAEDGTRLTIVWFTSEGFYSAKNVDHNGLARSFNALLREETMIRKASYDGLTGLPNMANFFKLADAARSRKKAFIYCDFCGLTGFNRKNGYAEGDKLIQAFAELLVAYFGKESCCRIAQDNFAVYTDEDGLEAKLEKLFEEWHSLNDGKSLPVRAGIYVDDNPQLEIGVACDRAKMACNVSPATGPRWHATCTATVMCRFMNTSQRSCRKRMRSGSIFWIIWTGLCRKNGLKRIFSQSSVPSMKRSAMWKRWPGGLIRKMASCPRPRLFRCWKMQD